MKPVVSENFINENSKIEREVEEIVVRLEDASIKDRALTELENANVVDSNADRDTFNLEYYTNSGGRLAKATFSIIGENCYFSWIWVQEPFRGEGFGSKLLDQCLSIIKQHGVSTVYVLPKSDKAVSMFSSAGFTKCENVNSLYSTDDL